MRLLSSHSGEPVARRSGEGPLPCLFLLSLLLLVIVAVFPAAAGAYATAGPASTPGAPGLPDGRVYEQVSPPNKGGSEAAAPHVTRGGYIFTSPEGNAVAYGSTGPIGNSSSGLQELTLARRSPAGWESFGAQPREAKFEGLFQQHLAAIAFSADFTKSLFQAEATYVPNEPAGNIFDGYLYNLAESTTAWLGQPMISDPLDSKSTAHYYKQGELAGLPLISAPSISRTAGH